MDPQVAWSEMLRSIASRDWDQAEEFAEGLLQWLHNDGFPPKTTDVAPMQRGWNRTMAEFGCRIALQYVKRARDRKSRRR